ncbi:TetR family transcriptional regulator C-terminal domain-containing protein [Dongia sedimenti]|uniref:TetR/AcrR family transcriptional regulator n=1 Tax=Dongia sedimenti TaxID=3064282 RepID=A0ABU0YFR8_9PROT|nr:TetR/AcrR family transcriptional regulator [Rhodospirillaceae bacterium R-7]
MDSAPKPAGDGGETAVAGPREQARAKIEAKILAAAEAVFAEHGFSGAAMSEIARRAGIPKPNLHYYCKTKEELYRRVLQQILDLWLGTADEITPDADPAAALSHYIAAKIDLARRRPLASRVFANEVIHGAPQIGDFLANELNDWVARKAKVIDGWVKAGKLQPVDPKHLFFMLWAATQTYADFAVQIAAVLGRKKLQAADYDAAAKQTTEIVLRGLGLKVR